MVAASFGFGNASHAGSPIGSGNTLTADPPVSRPPAKYGAPTKVQLFGNLEFNSFNPQTFSYTPPQFHSANRIGLAATVGKGDSSLRC